MEKFLSNDGLEVLIGGLDPRYAKEKDLASVAKSGSYNDLTDKPSIPSTPGDIDAMPASTTLSDLGGIASTEKGANNGVAPLNNSGKIDSQFLPSYVDDVIECYVVDGYEALSANWLSKTNGGNPLLPEGDKIYVVLSSGDYLNKVYRWAGTSYVSIGGDIDLSAYATQNWVNNQGFLTSHQDISGKVDSSSLASVATSGDYTDLINKPTIPSIPSNISAFTNDAGYLTQHQSLSDYALKSELPTVPTKTSDLTNDSGFLTSHQDISGKANSADLSEVALSGDYEDLVNKPTIPSIPTNVSSFTNDAGYLTSHQDISGKANVSDLATVATTGDYEDLIHLPTIPSKVSDLTNDSGFLTQHQDISGKANTSDLATVATTGDYADLVNTPSVLALDNSNNLDIGQNTYINSGPIRNIIIGQNNRITFSDTSTSSSIVGGSNNSVSNSSGVIIGGFGNMASKAYSIMSGYYNQTLNWCSLHVGQYNNPGDLSNNNLYFTIGNGSVSNRSNAFAVDGISGNVLLAGDVYIGCTDWTAEDGGGTLLEPFSGDYNDLNNLPTLFSGDYNDLDHLPRLFSGDYNDLTNKPTIPNYTGGTGISVNNGEISIIKAGYFDKNYAPKEWEDVDITYSFNTLDNKGFHVENNETLDIDGNEYTRLIEELSINDATVGFAGNEYDENDPEKITNQFISSIGSSGLQFKKEELDANDNITLINQIDIYDEGIFFYNEQAPEREGEDPTIVEGQLAFDTGTGNLNWNSEALVTSAKVPDAPTTDGTYMLICEVADGQPSFSWESIAIGGSY